MRVSPDPRDSPDRTPEDGSCPFCERIANGDNLAAEGPLTVAFDDAYPLSHGHVLVVPRRHEPDLFALDDEERREMWETVSVVRSRMASGPHPPDGFNVGVNVGTAAGQTVPHAHVHVIPRYSGDVADPRGGIRWVLPERARYWDA